MVMQHQPHLQESFLLQVVLGSTLVSLAVPRREFLVLIVFFAQCAFLFAEAAAHVVSTAHLNDTSTPH